MIQIDMEMPKCCDECFALDDHGDYPFCLISQDQRGYTFNVRKRRMPTCPLKVQEPRVMTLEEAKSASGYVIVQSHSCNILELQLIKDGFVYDSFTVPIAVDDLWWEGYNKHWRLWTFVPTDEQRSAIPWN